MLRVLQLLAQIMKFSYFPQVKVIHTSSTFHGQIYIPFLNWLLMIGTILVAAIFNNVSSLILSISWALISFRLHLLEMLTGIYLSSIELVYR